MNALLRKELRQILPAQLFLTALVTLAWFWVVDPEMALAPYALEQSAQHALVACFCLVEGAVLGLGQFGAEHVSGTQAFLVHRGTGHRGAFHAKVLAGLIGLAPLAIVPPVVFTAVHVFLFGAAGEAALVNLLRVLGASSFVVLGYAVGVLAAQLRRGWLVRIGVALLASLTGLLLLTVVHVPNWMFGAHPIVRVLSVELLTAAALLALAQTAFEEGPHLGRARAPAFVRAVSISALCLPLLAAAPFVAIVTQWPSAGDHHIVEDEAERLFVARLTDLDREELVAGRPGLSPYGDVYALTDEAGRPVELATSLSYRGYDAWSWWREEEQHPELEHYRTLFAPWVGGLTPLSEAPPVDTNLERTPEPLAWSGPWSEVYEVGSGWKSVVDLSSGTLWGRHPRLSGGRWRVLDALGTRVFLLQYGASGSSPVVCEIEGDRLWSVSAPDGDELPRWVPAPLPDGDRLVELERLASATAVRCGLWQPGGGCVARGERDVYAWQNGSWKPWGELDRDARNGAALVEEAPELQRWTLVGTTERGALGRVEVRDARTGEPRITLALDPAPLAAELWCLALPPAAAWVSWASPARPVTNPLVRPIGPAQVDPLRGRNRTWIPAVLLVVAAFLVRDLWRRLTDGGAPLERRLWWCGATLCLGLPAYLLARIVEPLAARRPKPETANAQPEQRFVIRTA